MEKTKDLQGPPPDQHVLDVLGQSATGAGRDSDG